jgi:hypothetical protein
MFVRIVVNANPRFLTQLADLANEIINYFCFANANKSFYKPDLLNKGNALKLSIKVKFYCTLTLLVKPDLLKPILSTANLE